jgi:hypothetical protein
MGTNNIKLALIFIAIIVIAATYTDPSGCTGSSQFYDPIQLQCTSCPINTIQASDFTYCNCSRSYSWNPDIIGFNSATSCNSISTGVIPIIYSHITQQRKSSLYMLLTAHILQ